MMLLLASFHEFTLFLKIVLWIAVPLILISFTVTTILHYRQKKRNAKFAAEHPELPQVAEADLSIVARLQREVLHYKKRIKELQHALSFVKEDVPKPLAAEKTVLPDVSEMTVAGLAVPGVDAVSVPLNSGKEADLSAGAEKAYLKDLCEEQKKHVQYLQQQLELRIKSYHDLEQKNSALSGKLDRLEKSLSELQEQHNKSLKLLDLKNAETVQ